MLLRFTCCGQAGFSEDSVEVQILDVIRPRSFPRLRTQDGDVPAVRWAATGERWTIGRDGVIIPTCVGSTGERHEQAEEMAVAVFLRSHPVPGVPGAGPHLAGQVCGGSWTNRPVTRGRRLTRCSQRVLCRGAWTSFSRLRTSNWTAFRRASTWYPRTCKRFKGGRPSRT